MVMIVMINADQIMINHEDHEDPCSISFYE